VERVWQAIVITVAIVAIVGLVLFARGQVELGGHLGQAIPAARLVG
jgi:hypothetical protein